MKKVCSLLAVFLSALLLFSCSKDPQEDNAGSSYPASVTITYKVTSTTAATATIVNYKNETGGNTDLTNVALPYSKNFNRTVNKNDILSVGYGTNTNQTVTLEILVNGRSVQQQTFTSTSGAIVYLFN